MIDIHEELNRLILRRRWITWCDRQWRGCSRSPRESKRMQRRLLKLAGRLACWRPTWEQRERRQFDGAIP